MLFYFAILLLAFGFIRNNAPTAVTNMTVKHMLENKIHLRWLKTVSSTLSLMGHNNHHTIPVDAKIMVSTNCPIIGEQVIVNIVAQ